MKLAASDIEDFQLHPLGFYYCSQRQGDITRRIHVYLEQNDFAAENEWHTHEFDLKSKVVFGALCNAIGHFHEKATGLTREYAVTYCEDKSELVATGRQGEICETVSFATLAGGEYWIKAGEIHKVKSLDFPCVTTVEFRHTGAEIFSYGVDEHGFERRKVNSGEQKHIERILRIAGLLK